MSVNKANAVWRGGLRDGKGTITSKSGVLSNIEYDFGRRFEDQPGTNPEELIAAAHAGCFAMALSGELAKAKLTAEQIDAESAVTLERTDAGPTVTKVHLTVRARVPGATAESFKAAADAAKAGCPISRLLRAEISLDASLQS